MSQALFSAQRTPILGQFLQTSLPSQRLQSSSWEVSCPVLQPWGLTGGLHEHLLVPSPLMKNRAEHVVF